MSCSHTQVGTTRCSNGLGTSAPVKKGGLHSSDIIKEETVYTKYGTTRLNCYHDRPEATPTPSSEAGI